MTEEMVNAFETEIAADVGIPAAVLLHHIVYWCDKNKQAEKNFHDGRYWVFASNVTLAERFPYLSLSTIKRALGSLISKGYVVVGCYNKLFFDRTYWYAPSELTLSIYAKCDNALDHFETVSRIQYDTSDTKIPKEYHTPPIIPPPAAKPKPKPKPKVDLAQFDVFWTAYPKKVDKQDAVKVWEKLNPNAELFEKIMSGLNRSVAFDHRFRERQYTPAPARWLRAENWNDEFELPKPAPQPTQQPTPKPKKDLAAQMREILPEKSAPPPPEVDAMIEEWKRNNNWR